MEIIHTEKLDLMCRTITASCISNGVWIIALGMCADVRVYEYGLENEYSCFPELEPEFSLHDFDRSICHVGDEPEDEDDFLEGFEFKLIALKNQYLLFTVEKKLYIWDWVEQVHLRTIICDHDIYYLHANANLVVYSGYEDAYYRYDNTDDDDDDGIPCTRFWMVTGTLRDFINNENGTRVVCDRFNRQLVNPMDWCIDQQLYMDMILQTNESLQLAVQNSDINNITAFRFYGKQDTAYFAYIGTNGTSYIKRVSHNITTTRVVSKGRYPSSLVVYRNMLCSLDAAPNDNDKYTYYLCSYDAVTLQPIYHQCIQFENNEYDWLDMTVAKNNLLICGDSSSLLHVFKTKHWDKASVLAYLLCLRRNRFLPELIAEYIISFLYATKFANLDYEYDDDMQQ